jgi:FMN phosphatase YigB (HAD superfamily)
MPDIQLVVLDLDNTLYDWVGFYIPSFLAMVRELGNATGVSEAELKFSFKRVHEKYRSSEYAFAIEELDVLKTKVGSLGTRDVFERYGASIEAFRETRRKTLRLYDGVAETLRELKAANKRLVAVTDATMYYAVRRLKDLGIEVLFDMICAPSDHGLPPGVKPEDARSSADPQRYQSRIPFQLSLKNEIRKPDTAILNAILTTTEVTPQNAIFVGDSLTKDILMAKRCGVWDVFAEYGTRVAPDFFNELLKITYWTDQDVEEDRRLREQRISPTYAIASFRELLDVIKNVERLPSR